MHDFQRNYHQNDPVYWDTIWAKIIHESAAASSNLNLLDTAKNRTSHWLLQTIVKALKDHLLHSVWQ